MIDDNVFDYESNGYEVCAFCGEEHVVEQYCVTIGGSKKTRFSWICDKLGKLLGMF